METDRLIERLAQGSGEISRLSSPSTRTAIWLGLAVPYVALVVTMMTLRADLAAKLVDPTYLIEQIAALFTGIAAAFAAFASTIPGFDRRYLLLPALPFGLWLGSLSLGCLQTWLVYGPDGLSVHPDWLCFPAIVLVGMVPAIVMAIMLRRGAPLTPHLTTALGGLAAAGLGDFGLRLFHPQDASAMVLVWQMGTVFMLTALAGWFGVFLLDWRVLTGNVRDRASLH
ncbi:MAG: NrsF family protein [Bradyrhizobium sp.]